jgi:ectoine hydroxylase-related dioxygenase (phytanoyl-CoA dioxygenase family)
MTNTVDLPRFPASAGADEVVAALRDAGGAVVEELVDPDTVGRVIAEMQPYLDATPPGADDFSGLATRRTGALVARSPASHAMIANPLVLDVADGFLWEGKTTFQLHLSQLIAIGPGSPAQALHRDQWCFDFFAFPDDVEVELSTMWALTDFTVATGATRVIPGSHRDGDEAVADEHRTVRAEMRPGSVLLYSGRTIHGGGANTSDEVRLGLNAEYTLGWLRQEENQYLSVPPEVARELPERLRDLIGYTLGAYALGYVDDVRHPRDVLDGTSRPVSFGG